MHQADKIRLLRHGLSHRLKKVASKYGVKFVFSARNKTGSIFSRVNREYEGAKNHKKCTIIHKNQFVECIKNVVYRIPMTCEHVYVGQTLAGV